MAKNKNTKKAKKQQHQKNRPPGKNRILIILILFVVLAVAATAVFFIAGAGDRTDPPSNGGDIYMNITKPVATIEMEDGSVIKLELDPVSAPNTVRNFIALANSGYYDGLIFHRVIPGFMIQGGCPRGDGTGGPGYNIKGEFAANNHDNPITHQRGVISMARSGTPNSAGSQFFIMVADAPHLDGQYAAFGRVIEGLDAVDRIVGVRRNQNDKPLEEQRIKKITVETFGTAYDPPDKM